MGRHVAVSTRPSSRPAELRRWTLTFRDPDLERDYQAEEALAARGRLRSAAVSTSGLWIVGGVVLATLGGMDVGPIVALVVPMVAMNLGLVAVLGRLPTLRAVQHVAAATSVVAAAGLLALTVATDTYETLAAPALVLVAVRRTTVVHPHFLGTVVAAVAYVVCFALGSIAAGVPLPVVQLLIVALAAASSSAGAYALERGARELWASRRTIEDLRAQLERLVHSYLAPDVARTLVANPDLARPGGRVTDITAMFGDLQGFTTFSEREDPRAVVELLNRYFEVVVPIIAGERGVPLQYAGDAFVAIWNAPEPHPAAALAATRAALAIQAAVAELATGHETWPRFRIGIASGPALVGNVGTTEHLNFTAIGDTMNLAARLQAVANAEEVVVDGATMERLGGRATGAPLEPLEVKGRRGIVSPWRIDSVEAPKSTAAGV